MAMDDAIQYLYTLNFSFQFHIGTLTIGTLTFARQCKTSCADGAKTHMETKESDDKHQLVMSNEASKNNHDGRCKSFFCVELSFWRHIHTLTFCIFVSNLCELLYLYFLFPAISPICIKSSLFGHLSLDVKYLVKHGLIFPKVPVCCPYLCREQHKKIIGNLRNHLHSHTTAAAQGNTRLK